jgi:histidine ammonia-lyase
MEDPYSFRCAPQVHGAARQVVSYLETVIGNECNSVSDNPLVFPDTRQILTCGNLHGQSTAFALDFAAIGITYPISRNGGLTSCSPARTGCQAFWSQRQA